MRKAEDYIIERETDHWADQDYSKSDIIRWIKQAQIDAIEETVKRCSEEAELDYGGGSCRKCGSNKINEQSILQVAEQLKKELE